jgi:hypothetical protein
VLTPLWWLLLRGRLSPQRHGKILFPHPLDIRILPNTPEGIRTSDLRIRNPLSENDKPIDNKELPQADSGAYKPAYKDNPKMTQNQPQNQPDDLAEIVSVWPKLPEYIKLAIKALVQTHIKGDK